MSRKKRKTIDNSLTELVSGLQFQNLLSGGSQLSTYGTIAHTNNYSLITLNRIILTYLYSTSGIFQTAIQLPIQDAISKGIEFESDELSVEDIDELMDFWDESGLWDVILNYFTWVRLYGGGAIIVNSNQEHDEPLNEKKLYRRPIEFYDVDRWQIDTNTSNRMDWEYQFKHGENEGNYYLYGIPIHPTKVIRSRGKKAPSYISRQLRGWGMSEGERMVRDLNKCFKTQDVLYEILDESKVDVYKIKNLANKLLTTGGTTSIKNRLIAANEIKSYMNALVLDQNEEFEQKTMTFSGLSEINKENRIDIAGAVRIPMTKLYGISASGFNSGEDDIENYNTMIDSEIRKKLNQPIRYLLRISMYHLWGYAPKSFRFTWPSLRITKTTEEENIKNAKYSRTIGLYDRGLIDSKETLNYLENENIVPIETKAGKGLIPNPKPPNPSEDIEPVEDVTV